MRPALIFVFPAVLLVLNAARQPAQTLHWAAGSLDAPTFVTGDQCMACHNGLTTPAGEDVSIGIDWRASIMANSARDPYWQAGVRREIMDHPTLSDAIQNECSRCHMPMSNELERAAGGSGGIFEHLPAGAADGELAQLAADGVSCALCHQITADRFGTEESFTGGFVVDTATAGEHGRVFGPFDIDSGRITIMRSATGFRPTEATHIQQSEHCATCHVLFTDAHGPDGEVIGGLPEQTPYQEWLNSEYRGSRSCQDCHMAAVRDSTAITAVLGQPRPGLSRHTFVGGNFFMLRMLNRYRDELGVTALPQELDAAARRTEEFLRTETARVTIERGALADDVVEVDVLVDNLAGHKLPTAYPSRRAWLHLTVIDRGGTVVFESGAPRPDGSIAGNDNDEDPARYEPHHQLIESSADVQIYESIMVAASGALTTGLLTGTAYVKDNRLLPRGFDKAGAQEDIAVHGGAVGDTDFAAGADRVRYRARVSGGDAPFRVVATLWYQPISFRWANNLRAYDAPETNRFVRYYASMAEHSAAVLARAEATVD